MWGGDPAADRDRDWGISHLGHWDVGNVAYLRRRDITHFGHFGLGNWEASIRKRQPVVGLHL